MSLILLGLEFEALRLDFGCHTKVGAFLEKDFAVCSFEDVHLHLLMILSGARRIVTEKTRRDYVVHGLHARRSRTLLARALLATKESRS
jgi:hypothetical protein